MKLVEAAVEDSGLPICLHLDHGEDFEIYQSLRGRRFYLRYD